MVDVDEPEQDENYNPEDEVIGNWETVNLPELPTITGEEDDEVLKKFRSKLYRWREKQWKERGIGELKFLKNKKTNKVRILMRQEQTHKIVANHLIQSQSSLCQLSKLKTSDKAWVWNCYDMSDDKPQGEKLCAKFTSAQDFKDFQEIFEKSYKDNDQLTKVEAKEEEKKEEEEQKVEPKEEEKKEEAK
eukprot:TRINITY_DN1213_c0_g1_i1.p1 TRINITY_DN1213_c0_g1~~TRINITY_DN1213_c0_g1_i1.p1  ORF type:complete len:189 (-),score=41.24 TRINITY_DN1213_c0_g1_i1:259-825(-)